MGAFGGNFGSNFEGAGGFIVAVPAIKTVTAVLCVTNSTKADLCINQSVKEDLCV